MGPNDCTNQNARERKLSHANNRIDKGYRKAAINKRHRQIYAHCAEYKKNMWCECPKVEPKDS